MQGTEYIPGNLGMTAEQESRLQSSSPDIALPEKLAKIKKADNLPAIKYKWNGNEVWRKLFGKLHLLTPHVSSVYV